MSKRFFPGQGNGFNSGDISKRMREQELRSKPCNPIDAADEWRQAWHKMIAFLNAPEQADIKSTTELRRGSGKLWDNNGKEYRFEGRFITLEKLEEMVLKVRDANNSKT